MDRPRKVTFATISGLSGIGKTALSLHLIPKIQHNFEYVIWRSLRRYSPPLETTLKNLLEFLLNKPEIELPSSIPARLSLLMEYLQKTAVSLSSTTCKAFSVADN